MSYTYFIKHKPTGLKYYGSSTRDPKQFWKTYFTSSDLVWFFIKKDGIESFDAKITRIFDYPWQAIDHENRIFRRTGINTNPKYLNRRGVRNKFGFRNQTLYELVY